MCIRDSGQAGDHIDDNEGLVNFDAGGTGCGFVGADCPCLNTKGGKLVNEVNDDVDERCV